MLVFLQNKLSINTELSYKKISFCNDSYPNVNGKNKSVSINFILLLHYSIFKCKNRKETPCMFQFEISISERRGWEEIIAFNRNKTDQHIEKWQHLYYNLLKMFRHIHIYTILFHPLKVFFSNKTLFSIPKNK